MQAGAGRHGVDTEVADDFQAIEHHQHVVDRNRSHCAATTRTANPTTICSQTGHGLCFRRGTATPLPPRLRDLSSSCSELVSASANLKPINVELSSQTWRGYGATAINFSAGNDGRSVAGASRFLFLNDHRNRA